MVQSAGIIVGRKGNPGTVQWVAGAFYPIDTTFYVVRKDSAPPLEVIYYFLESAQLSRLTADSAVPGLNRNFVYREPIVFPEGAIVDFFAKIIGPMNELIRTLEDEVRGLEELRDYLLPRLVNGNPHVN